MQACPLCLAMITRRAFFLLLHLAGQGFDAQTADAAGITSKKLYLCNIQTKGFLGLLSMQAHRSNSAPVPTRERDDHGAHRDQFRVRGAVWPLEWRLPRFRYVQA